MTTNEQFLVDMAGYASAANHCFPEYAACEAAVETAWGTSSGFKEGANVFGNKQRAKPVYQTLSLTTWEVVNGQRVNQVANFIKFPDVVTAFKFRMDTLRQFMAIYAPAIKAQTGEQFVRNVSGAFIEVEPGAGKYTYQFTDGWYQWTKPRWATDPNRANVVLEIYNAHKLVFDPQTSTPAQVTA